jgi:hypothetical protein
MSHSFSINNDANTERLQVDLEAVREQHAIKHNSMQDSMLEKPILPVPHPQ